MRDRFGRPVRSLRISVTNVCNLRCVYCHREGQDRGNRQMTAGEIGEIVRVGSEFGISKIKLTGGEPLMRDDLEEIVAAVTQPGIEEVSMVTNGVKLAERARGLARAGLKRVNVSLDTLDPRLYAKLTGVKALDRVLAGIEAALDAHLVPLKLNMLVLKGVNEREVGRMIEFTRRKGVMLQLLELIRLPDSPPWVYDHFHFDLRSLEQEFESVALEVRTRNEMQARRVYRLEGGEVEVVRPMHNSEFCAHCTRLRLTHDGYLKPCLMRNDNLVDVLSPLREGDGDGVREAFRRAVELREPYFKGG